MRKEVKHTWNYRVMAHHSETCEDNVYFAIHEVHYEDDIPKTHTTKCVPPMGESTEELLWALKKMMACLEQPIIWAGDTFPRIYKKSSE